MIDGDGGGGGELSTVTAGGGGETARIARLSLYTAGSKRSECASSPRAAQSKMRRAITISVERQWPRA